MLKGRNPFINNSYISLLLHADEVADISSYKYNRKFNIKDVRWQLETGHVADHRHHHCHARLATHRDIDGMTMYRK